MRELMYFFIEHHCQYKHDRRDTTQPFKFFIDSRFSSLDVLRKMDEPMASMHSWLVHLE